MKIANKLNAVVNASLPSLSVAHSNTITCPIILKADTGASAHYVTTDDSKNLLNVKIAKTPKQVQLPNEEIIESSHDVSLPIHGVHPIAKEATIFPALTSSSLLSIGQLCNDDCTVIFTKKDMKVIKNKNLFYKVPEIRPMDFGMYLYIPQYLFKNKQMPSFIRNSRKQN